MSKLRVILWGLIAGLVAAVAWLAFDHRSQVGRTAVSVVNATIAPLVQQFPGMTLSQPTTVLFMGTDVVYEHSGKSVQPKPASYRGNSDSLMCVRLDPINNRLVVLQIPRDTEVTIGGRIRKINAANPMGGPTLAEQTVSELLGTPIDHYVIMNVHGIVDIFNEIGGITVKVPKRMQYMDWTAKLKIDLQPGSHTLTGNQAMGFVRFRHDALGDIGRLQRQQMFMDACFRKIMEPACWLHAPAMIDIAQKNIDTDIPAGDILKLANFVHLVPRKNVVMVVLPGRFGNNGDWIANADVQNAVRRLLDPSQDTAACRRNISIFVENGTSERSFSWKLAVALRKLGYNVCVGGKSEQPVAKTRIIAQKGNCADASMIQQDLGNIGEVVNASIGNIGTSITIVASKDIILDKICKSSPDAPYLVPVAAVPIAPPPLAPPQSLTVSPLSSPVPGMSGSTQPDMPVSAGTNQSELSVRIGDETEPDNNHQTLETGIDSSNSKTAGQPNYNQDKDSTAPLPQDEADAKGMPKVDEAPVDQRTFLPVGRK